MLSGMDGGGCASRVGKVASGVVPSSEPKPNVFLVKRFVLLELCKLNSAYTACSTDAGYRNFGK